MRHVRKWRTAALGTLVALAATLGLAAPAQAAPASFECYGGSYTFCAAEVGTTIKYDPGFAGLQEHVNSGLHTEYWIVSISPRNGFTPVLRVLPSSGGYIDYKAANNGRQLHYRIRGIQMLVQGHTGISRVQTVTYH